MIDRAAVPGTSRQEDSPLSYWKARAEKAEAALADALGLLRNAAGNETWHAAVTEFLAKHGPSP